MWRISYIAERDVQGRVQGRLRAYNGGGRDYQGGGGEYRGSVFLNEGLSGMTRVGVN